MRAATLFSGIGAPEQARPDWAWLWSAEIDPFASAVHAARHPHSINLGNVTADDFAERALAIGQPDIIVFGSPCQSFSIAGKRLGLDDPRGNLALVALEVVRRVRPRWFLFENVPGLLSSERGEDFAAFLCALAECGYHGCWRVLDAQYFGLAQRRERVFFVGCLGDWRGPAAVLFEREGLQGHPAPSRAEGQGAARPLAAGVAGGSGYRNDADTAENLIAGTIGANHGNIKAEHAWTGQLVANCLNAHGGSVRMDGESETFVPVPMFADCCEGSNGAGIGKAGDPAFCLDRKASHQAVAFTCKDHGADAGDIAPTLRAMPHDGSHANGGGQVAVAFHENQRGEMTVNDTAGSLKIGGGKPGQGYPAVMETYPCLPANEGGTLTQIPPIQQDSAVRRLTPRECEKLMGFQPDYTLVKYRGKDAKDGPRYRACGNSMAVPVLRWILSRVEAVDRAFLAQRARLAA